MRRSTTSTLPPRRCRFGRFELRPARASCSRTASPSRLGARAFDLLVALADRPGELIAKDEFLATRVARSRGRGEQPAGADLDAAQDPRAGSRWPRFPARGYRFNLPVYPDAGAPAGPPRDPQRRRSGRGPRGALVRAPTCHRGSPGLYGRVDDISAIPAAFYVCTPRRHDHRRREASARRGSRKRWHGKNRPRTTRPLIRMASGGWSSRRLADGLLGAVAAAQAIGVRLAGRLRCRPDGLPIQARWPSGCCCARQLRASCR